VPDDNDVFKQLEGALCLWARAKGEVPAKSYFNVLEDSRSRILALDGHQYIIAIAKIGDDMVPHDDEEEE